jgi:hypothetical protein
MGDAESFGRGSLDSSFSATPQPHRIASGSRAGDDAFEEVKLNDEARPTMLAPTVSRRRLLFAKFGVSATAPLPPPAPSTAPQGVAPPHHSLQLFSGRRLGQNGLGAEMATIPQDRELGAMDGDAAVVDAVPVQ